MQKHCRKEKEGEKSSCYGGIFISSEKSKTNKPIRAKQRHMIYQERQVKMKEEARQMGVDCKREPVGEEGLEDNVLKGGKI